MFLPMTDPVPGTEQPCRIESHLVKKMWHIYTIEYYSAIKKSEIGASLVAQWLRICLPMQGTRIRALVWEDPTCRGATKPVSHNY